MAREKLSYSDYRPIKRGETGYSKTKRHYISPSTGDVISVRQFQKHAHTTKTTTVSKEKLSAMPIEPKPRKPRADKGYTKADYKAFREQQKYYNRLAKIEKAIAHPKRIKDRNDAIARFNSAYANYVKKNGREPDQAFYDKYDVIKHPENYTKDERVDAYDYLWDDADDFYFGEGETP